MNATPLWRGRSLGAVHTTLIGKTTRLGTRFFFAYSRLLGHVSVFLRCSVTIPLFTSCAEFLGEQGGRNHKHVVE